MATNTSEKPATIKCLSFRQPYATWFFLQEQFERVGLPPKTIENRTWTTTYRGPLLIHASKTFEDDAIPYWSRRYPAIRSAIPTSKKDYPTGVILGIADLANVVLSSHDPWFVGRYGFVLKGAQAFPKAVPYSGNLGLFSVRTAYLQERGIHLPTENGQEGLTRLEDLENLVRDYYTAAQIGDAMEDPTYEEMQDYEQRLRELMQRTELLGLHE